MNNEALEFSVIISARGETSKAAADAIKQSLDAAQHSGFIESWANLECIAETSDAASAAIAFALKDEFGMEFLRCWYGGDFDSIRREWTNVPEEVFIGADTQYQSSSDEETVNDHAG